MKWSLLGALRLAGLGVVSACAQSGPAPIVIDYPADGSVFPPDMAAPTFLWRDPAPGASSWQVDVSFADGSPAIHMAAKGERMQIGEIDPRCVAPTNQPPRLTPQQAAAHTWIPDLATWAAIKKHSVAGPATVAIRGFPAGNARQPVSRGHTLLNTSVDPVGAPIFYRDVPLMPSKTENGVIKPLDTRAVPLIAWRLRDVAETRSRVLLEDMHTCANCHSFSSNGRTLGMDLDGPENDKSLYTLVPVQQKMTIRNEDVISWTSFRGEFGSQLREGFMSQVSPDGRRVVTTIKPPGTPGPHFYYVANFEDYRFLQVFYPTRRPSGDTWDMNPSRSWLPNSPRKLVHEITSSLRMVMRFCTGTMVYRLLSFSGPSRSIPKVLPSPEKEWQLAQVCMSSSSTRLRVSATSRRRHAISGTARESRGLITPFSCFDGISGTSR